MLDPLTRLNHFINKITRFKYHSLASKKPLFWNDSKGGKLAESPYQELEVKCAKSAHKLGEPSQGCCQYRCWEDTELKQQQDPNQTSIACHNQEKIFRCKEATTIKKERCREKNDEKFNIKYSGYPCLEFS